MRSAEQVIAMCAVMICIVAAFAAGAEGEVSITRRLAPKYSADAEVRLADGTRCDLLSDDFAIEVDWAHKQYEAWGQAVYYGALTDRNPGVLLITRDARKDSRHIERAKVIGKKLGIKLWIEVVP